MLNADNSNRNYDMCKQAHINHNKKPMEYRYDLQPKNEKTSSFLRLSNIKHLRIHIKKTKIHMYI